MDKRRTNLIVGLFLMIFILAGESQADIAQPYSNMFLSIDYYDIGQSFKAETDYENYAYIYAWVDPDWGSGNVGMKLQLGGSVLASGTSSVGSDGMLTLDVSDVSFTAGTSYGFYLMSTSRFAKVWWEGYNPIERYADGQLITGQGYVEAPPYAEQRSLSEFDLAFQVVSSPVPVPGAIWLLGSGLVGLAAIRRKRNSISSSI